MLLVAILGALAPQVVSADGEPPIWDPKPPGGGAASDSPIDAVAEEIGATLLLVITTIDAI